MIERLSLARVGDMVGCVGPDVDHVGNRTNERYLGRFRGEESSVLEHGNHLSRHVSVDIPVGLCAKGGA